MATYRLLSILWKQNSPYGGYNANDVVDVFFDDTTAGYKVYKNGLQITSGNSIPPIFVYNNQNMLYYKNEDLNQTLICVNGAKLKYTRIGEFPYLSKELLSDHPTCNVTLVCDTVFNDLPTITNASSSTATDGSITVTASSKNFPSLPIQYKLNSDFVYGYGQTSGTFDNLKAGNYTIYARLSNNCRASIIAKVGVSESYGVLYRLQYVTPLGDTHKTEILQRGFSGSVINVEGGADPTIYNLRGESQKDKFTTIIPGEIETTFISTTDGYFQSLYTNDPEKYRLKHSINGSAVWTGKLLTNQYEENYTNPPYEVKIVATDSLPQLNEILFLDDFGNRLSGKVSQIKLIAYILNKLKLDLKIRSACNIYAESMNSTVADDPLAQAYVDLSRYYLIQDNPTCWDVLTWILDPYNAQIIQWDNCWNIIRVEERVNNFKYREYTSAGVYSTNGTITSLKDLKNASYSNRMVWAERNQKLRIMPGFGSIRLLYDLGNRKNFLENGDFSLTDRLNYDLAIGDDSIQQVPNLNGFEIINESETAIYIGYEKIENRNIGIALTSITPNSENYIKTNSFNLKMGNIDKLRFKVRFKIQRYLGSTNQNYSFYYIRTKMIIQYGSLYLADDGLWYSAPKEVIVYVEKANEWIEFELISSAPIDPITGLPSTDYVTGENFQIKLFLPNANDSEYYSGSTTTSNIETLKTKLTASLFEDSKTSFYDVSGTYTITGMVGKYIYYYELKNDNTNNTSLPNIIRPNDFNASTNPKVWVLTNIQKYDENIFTTIIIDNFIVEVLANGQPYPDTDALEQSMENENDLPIQKQIYHGSLKNFGKTLVSYGINTGFGINIFGNDQQFVQTSDYSWGGKIDYIANSSDLAYTGYLRNSSGVGFDKWKRTGIDESKTLEGIFMDSYTSQYNQPWRMINGSMYSDDTFFSPINALKETIDNNRIYMPVSLSINFYKNMYDCEFLELLNYTTNTGSAFTSGFSSGFN